jgi:broad specificity phosphatase PhoE
LVKKSTFAAKNNYKLKSKKIYLIRHGQTDYNLKGIVQGSGVDSSLNSTGIAQSKAFYLSFKHIKFDKIYTSTLKRSIQSVEGFLNEGIIHEKLSELNEISWGNREGVEISPEEDAYYHQVINSWQEGKTNLPIEGGESPEEVQNRQKVGLTHILSNTSEENILICMHGRAIRILLCTILNYPLQCMDMFDHQNLCLYQLSYTGSMFTVERFNDISHLADL